MKKSEKPFSSGVDMSKSATVEVLHSVPVGPKTAFIAEIAPGRRLVELSVELANFPGALREASEVLSKHNVNILSGFHDASRWSFFADLTESKAGPEQLSQELGQLKVVSGVRVQEGSMGVLVDALHYPFMWGKYRAIMVRADVMSALLGSIRSMFGEDGAVGKVMLFAMGEAAGRTFFDIMVDQVGASTVKKELVNVMNLYSSFGWGIFRLIGVNFERGSSTIQAVDSFECVHVQGRKSRPYSHFMRGHIAGLCSGLFGRAVDVVETHCIARGDPYCQFRVEPKKATE